MLATVANGGTLYKPSIVLRQEALHDPTPLETLPTVLHQLRVPAQYIAAVQQGLWSVVNDPRGTGKLAHHDQIAIAGKTGTAQAVPLAERSRQEQLPEQYRDHAWFAAYAPFEAPRIAVVVMIEHAGKHGGDFAGYAKTLIEAYLQQSYPVAAVPLNTVKFTR
jgi:penicillin-binding protein 2